MSGKETLNLEGITPESIEAVDEGLQLNQEEPQEEQVELELTFDEKKKYLRAMRNKEEFPMPVTDEEIDVLTETTRTKSNLQVCLSQKNCYR